ncbi:MAG: YaaA family protein [Erysipelothrix sp.]|jgi:cytoplasmic iron level regulating protein YaaA (DUF328/UPF0246 family)|nr:YaaA family protein [Erysipelothrix sp.]
MKFILSPAKTLKLQPTSFTPTTPQSHSLSEKLLKKLKKFKLNQYDELFSISSKLAQQTYDSIQLDQIHPAIFYYHGEAFKSLQISEMSDEDIQFMQEHVYIYSALYGLLRPLDGIQYYRLDFLTPLEKLGIKKARTIIKKDVTNKLVIDESEVVVSICSQEYKDMIDLKRLQVHKKVIDVSFISIQNDNEKIVSVHSKQARGLFLRKCVQDSITTLEGLLSIESFSGWNLDIDSSTQTHRIFKKTF